MAYKLGYDARGWGRFFVDSLTSNSPATSNGSKAI